MKERPILFSAPMVRAILEDRKTQTRRVVNPQPEREPSEQNGAWYPSTTSKKKRHYADESHFRRGLPLDWSPYGATGDRLWVRETWAKHYCGLPGTHFKPHYRAELPDDHDAAMTANHAFGLMKWMSPIHMPRWASRITLEVVNVLVERLQQISEQDAKAEGVESVAEYAALWDSINGGGSWAENPWVWVVEFRAVPADLRVRQVPGGAA